MKRPLALLLLLSTLALPLINARITTVRIRNDDRPGIMLMGAFGFGREPHLEVEVSAIQLHHTTDPFNLEKLSFHLIRDHGEELEEEPSFRMDQRHGCDFLEEYEQHTSLLFTFADFKDKSNAKGANATKPFKHSVPSNKLGAGNVGYYALFFANCEENVLVSFDVNIHAYSMMPGDTASYLSVGEMELPTLYLVYADEAKSAIAAVFVRQEHGLPHSQQPHPRRPVPAKCMQIMFCVFAVALGGWCYNLYVYRHNAHRIHYLMTALGAFKVLTLLAQCGMYHYIRITGAPDGWNIAFYIFSLFRGVFLFVVIILIGAGWSYMTPHLGDNDRKVLILVIPLQVCMEMAIISIDEFGPAKRSWLAWRDLMHLMDIVCCAAILFPIVWRIKHLRDAAQTDGKADRSLRQLIMFRHFYVLVLCYIYITRILVFLLHSTLPTQFYWMGDAAEELATLVFYTLTALQFRPHAGTGYYQLLNDEGIEMASARV